MITMVFLKYSRNNLFRTVLAGTGFTPIMSRKGRGMNSVILHTHLPQTQKNAQTFDFTIKPRKIEKMIRKSDFKALCLRSFRTHFLFIYLLKKICVE
ncbi:hypothetical protein CPT03_16495 [Pedobacter ginsengisoli]|uniref:Uncharacterized protein n=1 Tax=Pedobacter ginsengisoli TaxID=363852 RepID=A0A2D1U8K2_9SPHI|nr:hypothetical protein CPT03_16495 [Pedobacter ginsengisoli]